MQTNIENNELDDDVKDMIESSGLEKGFPPTQFSKDLSHPYLSMHSVNVINHSFANV